MTRPPARPARGKRTDLDRSRLPVNLSREERA